MSENRRLTHEKAVRRIKEFVETRKFVEADLATLKQKKECLDKSYADFVDEHLKFIHFVSKETLKSEDQHLETIEHMYQETCIEIRRQIDYWEECIDTYRNKAIQSSSEKTKRVSESKEITANKKGDRENEKEDGEIETLEADSSSEGTAQENSMRSTVVVQRNANTNRRPQRELQVRVEYRRPHRNRMQCHNCGGAHRMFDCRHFLRLSVLNRRVRVSELNLCENCLMKREHTRIHRCQAGACKCGKFHNSLLCSRAIY